MENIFESDVKPLALKQLSRAIMPNDQGSITRQTKFFLGELEKRKYQKNDKGKIFVVDAEGNPVENAHGWPTEAQDVIEEVFNTFFEDNGLPLTSEGCFELLRKPNITPEERIKLTKHLNSLDNE